MFLYAYVGISKPVIKSLRATPFFSDTEVQKVTAKHYNHTASQHTEQLLLILQQLGFMDVCLE